MTSETDAGIVATKRGLRERQKARRAKALESGGTHLNDDLVREGVALLGSRPSGIVSGYYPMPGEIWPLRLMGALKTKGHALALPVMQGKADPLLFRAWSPGDELIAGVWGIRQPAPSQPAVLPDILLVPLLAFDARGYRLGYGGGRVEFRRRQATGHADEIRPAADRQELLGDVVADRQPARKGRPPGGRSLVGRHGL